MGESDDLDRCLDDLRRRGLLLASDGSIPSVASVVTERPATLLRKHPERARIERTLLALDAHPDVLGLRLVGGKRTFVHRALWPELLFVATSRDAWQTEFLPTTEAALLDAVERRGHVLVDDSVATEFDAVTSELGRELESRLLVLGRRVERPNQPAARTLTAWSRWMEPHGEPLRAAMRTRAPLARQRLDRVARALGPSARLPWWERPLRRRWR